VIKFNVPNFITEDTMRVFFGQIGEVTECHIVTGRDTGEFIGCCAIGFNDTEKADRAVMLNQIWATRLDYDQRSATAASKDDGAGSGGKGSVGGSGGMDVRRIAKVCSSSSNDCACTCACSCTCTDVYVRVRVLADWSTTNYHYWRPSRRCYQDDNLGAADNL
jgi:hypothetical protein